MMKTNRKWSGFNQFESIIVIDSFKKTTSVQKRNKTNKLIDTFTFIPDLIL